MPTLVQTVDRLTALRKSYAPSGDWGPLTQVSDFGSNPGEIEAGILIPPGLAPGAPLVVVLHGCTQSASGYDRGSGWSELAAEHGFAVLFPQQTRSNNPNLCFNWFVAGDVTGGRGEAESIRQVIAASVATYSLDRRRIFITGLSAGGAMTASMLATSPEIFAGGAIIAGLPHATASNVNEAFERMRGTGLQNAAATAASIRAASSHTGPWPQLSVWHGSADTTVDAANAVAITAGWADLCGLGAPVSQTINGHRRQVWRDAAGVERLESFTIAGMGHGTPIAANGREACGVAGPHMLDVGISSTRRIAAFWGIAPAVAAAATRLKPPQNDGGIEAVINNALRQAGLLR